jgi:hypothetical protein
VTGAGTEAANGVYHLQPHPAPTTKFAHVPSTTRLPPPGAHVPSTTRPSYVKDAAHQIYNFMGMWKIAHNGVAGSQLYINIYPNTSTPVCGGWRLSGGLGPSPAALACADDAENLVVSDADASPWNRVDAAGQSIALSNTSPSTSFKCASKLDCELNGVCTSGGACSCNSGWTGATCGMLNLLPATRSAGYQRAGYSSWGGSVTHSAKDGAWIMYLAEMDLHCGQYPLVSHASPSP